MAASLMKCGDSRVRKLARDCSIFSLAARFCWSRSKPTRSGLKSVLEKGLKASFS